MENIKERDICYWRNKLVEVRHNFNDGINVEIELQADNRGWNYFFIVDIKELTKRHGMIYANKI